MKNLFEQFANGDAEITSSNASLYIKTEFVGTISIKKGGLSYEVDFYAHVSEMTYKGCVSVEDWDISSTNSFVFNGIPVDNISRLKSTLIESGLSTVANSLDVPDNKVGEQVALQINNNDMFKRIFGKKSVMWETLSEDGRNIKRLEHSIKNYEKLNVKSFHISNFLEVDEVTVDEATGKETVTHLMPSIERLKELLNELKNK